MGARAANGLLVPGTVDGAGGWLVPALPPDSTWDVVVRVAADDAVLAGETRGVRAGAADVVVSATGR